MFLFLKSYFHLKSLLVYKYIFTDKLHLCRSKVIEHCVVYMCVCKMFWFWNSLKNITISQNDLIKLDAGLNTIKIGQHKTTEFRLIFHSEIRFVYSLSK